MSVRSCCSVLGVQPVEDFLGQKLETQKKLLQVDCPLNGQVI